MCEMEIRIYYTTKSNKMEVNMENKELVQANRQEITPADLLKIAVEGGADLDKLEKLMDLQERWEEKEAKKAYNTAMVDVHKDMPMVGKTLKNVQTRSSYASLDLIISKTKEVYTKHGFSISFFEGHTDKENHIRICADVIHKLGHKENYYYDVPLDGKGIKGNTNMTAIHAKASSTSYGRRYLMCMIWNIPTGDDTDGNMPEAPVEYIDEKQLSQLRDMVDNNDCIDEKKLFTFFKIASLENLPKEKYAYLISILQKKIADAMNEVKNADQPK